MFHGNSCNERKILLNEVRSSFEKIVQFSFKIDESFIHYASFEYETHNKLKHLKIMIKTKNFEHRTFTHTKQLDKYIDQTYILFTARFIGKRRSNKCILPACTIITDIIKSSITLDIISWKHDIEFVTLTVWPIFIDNLK